MKKKMSLFYFLIVFSLSACGVHTSDSFGYSNSNKPKETAKATTPLELLKLSIDTNDKESFLNLINSQIDLNSLFPDGRTPLIQAVVGGNATFVHLLLLKGVDVNIKDKSDKTALDHAILLEQKRIELILDFSLLSKKQNILMKSVMEEDVDSVDKLLNEGVNPNFLMDGETPLTKSILQKSIGVFKTLAKWRDVELGLSSTDVNLPNAEGVKPLKLAKIKANKNFVKVLSDLGANE